MTTRTKLAIAFVLGLGLGYWAHDARLWGDTRDACMWRAAQMPTDLGVRAAISVCNSLPKQ